MLLLRVRLRAYRANIALALQPAMGCPNFQHLWHCVVADACHITADVLNLPMKRTEGVTLSISVSGILTIIVVAFLSFLSSSLSFRNLAPAISNLCVTRKAFLTSSSKSFVLLGIAVSETPWMITSRSVGALLKGRYLGSSGPIDALSASVILSIYFAYCPESVPEGAVSVIVPFVLLEKTCRLVGALHSHPVRMVATARDIFASSPAGSASGFAVILVANSFLLATFHVCVGFWLLFFPFGCSFACCSCVFFWNFVVGCLGGLVSGYKVT